MRTIEPGARGPDVRDVQSRLTALGHRVDPEEHGRYGGSTERAVREFQQGRHLLVTGVVDTDTWEDLVEAGYSLGDRLLYLRYPYVRGDDVRELQARLNLLGFDAGREDGIFGDRTDRAVRDFQRNVGLIVDGVAGLSTTEHLDRLRPVSPGPGKAEVREAESLRSLPSSLVGVRVAVDAGHGRDDPGEVGAGGAVEADVAYRMVEALAAELRARGAVPILLRGPLDDPPVRDRARAANDGGAALLLSVHVNAHPDAAAEGASSYYYGSATYVSPAGRRLADLIQEEVTGQLGLADGRSHPKALPLLRETRMPAVQVEPCFISNPQEEAALVRPTFQRDLGRALATAIERFFATGASDPAPEAGATGSSAVPPSGDREDPA